MTPESYIGRPNGRQGAEFKPFPNRGYLSLEVLPVLNGRPWDGVALGYVHSLRPTHVRVVDDGIIQLDSQTWRVTVYVDKDGFIECIEQEVEVGLPEGCCNGWSMQAALQHGLDSPQVKWHTIRGGITIGRDGTYKTTDDGTIIPFPSGD